MWSSLSLFKDEEFTYPLPSPAIVHVEGYPESPLPPLKTAVEAIFEKRARYTVLLPIRGLTAAHLTPLLWLVGG